MEGDGGRQRFPDERTSIEATPLPATSAVFGSVLGLGLGWFMLLLATILSHNPLPPRPPARSGQTSPHKPRLVVS